MKNNQEENGIKVLHSMTIKGTGSNKMNKLVDREEEKKYNNRNFHGVEYYSNTKNNQEGNGIKMDTMVWDVTREYTKELGKANDKKELAILAEIQETDIDEFIEFCKKKKAENFIKNWDGDVSQKRKKTSGVKIDVWAKEFIKKKETLNFIEKEDLKIALFEKLVDN